MSRERSFSSSTDHSEDVDAEAIRQKVDTLSESMVGIIEENTRLSEKLKHVTEQLLQHEVESSKVINYKDYTSLLEAKESAVMMWREALKEIARLTEKAKHIEKYETLLKEYEEQFQTFRKQFEESQNTKKEVEKRVEFLSKEKEKLERDLITKTKYVEVCETKLRKVEEMYKQKLEERTKEYNSAKKISEDRITELLEAILNLEVRNKQLEESQEQAQDVANNCIQKTQELTLQVAILEQQKQAAENELKDHLDKHAKVMLENEEATRKLKSIAIQEQEKMKENFEKKITALTEELQRTSSELKLAQKKVAELQNQQTHTATDESESSQPWQLKYKLQKAEEHVHQLEMSSRKQEQRIIEQEAHYRKQIKNHLESIDNLKTELEGTRLELLETKKRLTILDQTYHLQKSEAKAEQKKLKSKIEKLEEALYEQKLRHAAVLRRQESNPMMLQMKELIQNYEFIIKEMKRHMDKLIENVEVDYQKRFCNLPHLQEVNRKLTGLSEREASEHILKTQKQLVDFSSQVDKLGQQFQRMLGNKQDPDQNG